MYWIRSEGRVARKLTQYKIRHKGCTGFVLTQDVTDSLQWQSPYGGFPTRQTHRLSHTNSMVSI